MFRTTISALALAAATGTAAMAETTVHTIDADGDGYVTVIEYTSYTTDPVKDETLGGFAALDDDGNGKIGPEEVQLETGSAAWELVDSDADGWVTPEEYSDATFHYFDENDDDRIDVTEMDRLMSERDAFLQAFDTTAPRSNVSQ